MSTQGKGSDPGSSVVNEIGNTAVTSGVAVGSVIAFTAVPVVGPFIALAGGGYLLYRAVKRGMKKTKR